MNISNATTLLGPRPVAASAFSLVEVTIAIGIFAFVIVGIIGLFPAALRQRSDAALETRATMIAQQIFEGLRGSPSLSEARMPDEVNPQREDGAQFSLGIKDLKSGPLVLGYSRQGTTVNHVYDNDSIWQNGDSGGVVAQQSLVTIARIEATPVAMTPRLYSVTVDVSAPPELPADKRRTETFTDLVYSP